MARAPQHIYDPEQLSEAEVKAGKHPGNDSLNSSSTTPGNISYTSGKSEAKNSEMDTSTVPGQTSYSSQIPDSEKSLYNSSSTKPGRLSFKGWGRRKKALVGGGVATVGVGGAIAFLTFFAGPLQFIHMAQLLQRFHFSASQDMADDRFSKIGRYVYYGKGKPENTRLNFLSNKWADRIETNFNKSGVQTAYTPTFGFFDGYVIDPAKVPDLEVKTNDGAKKYFKAKYGINLEPRNGKLFADANQVGFFKSQRSMIKQMMTEAGYSKIGGSIQSRIMGKRAGIDWHPIKRLDRKILRTADARIAKWRENRIQTIERGAQLQPTTETRTGTVPDETEQQRQERNASASGSAAEADSTISDSQNVRDEANKGNRTTVKGFQDRLSTKVTLGGVSAAGVLCIVKGLDDNASEIKQTQVILPLMRMGMEAVSLGNQVMSGDDVDMEQLGNYSRLLNGVDSDGKSSSWTQAKSIQAELGKANSGIEADSTLRTISQGTPFSFLNQGKFEPVMDGMCGGAGTGAQVLISFFGGPVSALAGLGLSAVLGPPIMDAMAHWLAGKAIDPDAVGAKYGNYINYGARLAANDQAIAGGGVELDATEAAEVKAIADASYKDEFRSKGTAYKLFNPYDHQSVISRFIDHGAKTSGSIDNFANMFTGFGNILDGAPKLFEGQVNAEGSYDYGFPEFGFSINNLNNDELKNPLLNSEEAAKILDGPTGQEYIDRAKKCFGVEIFTDTADRWAVSGGENVPKYSDIKDSGCGEQSLDWLRLRFFIFDTQIMESIACYEGDDEACGNVEVGANAIGEGGVIPSDSELPSGTVQQLAQQILANPNISYPFDASSRNGSTKVVLQTLAAGQPAPVTCPSTSIRSTSINPGILQFLVELGSQMKVGVNAITDKCHSSGSNHYKGQAVDFECKAVAFDITKADPIAQKYGGKRNSETCSGDEHWHYDFIGS